MSLYDYFLWTKRSKWVKGHKFSGCIFCRIYKGDKSVPSRVVYKDKDVLILMNLFPYNTGHIQLIPVRHVKSLEDMTPEEISKVFLMVKKVVKMLRKALNPKGFNIGANIGEFAGASIEHFHFHIVPRFNHDLGFMETTCRTKVMPQSIDQTYKKIMKHVDMLKK